jgi:hypothetical protein
MRGISALAKATTLVVRVEERLKSGQVERFVRAEVGDRSIQDQAVNGGAGENFGERPLEVLRVGQVADHGNDANSGLPFQLRAQLIEATFASRQEDEIGAVLARQQTRKFSPEACRRSGHEHPSPAEIHLLHPEAA